MDRRGREGRRLVPGFLREDTGTMTILTLVFFVVVMAFGGMAIDIGRLYAVHGQMQAYVDEVALAAASQLDGQGAAISRACLAATGDAKCYTKAPGSIPLSVVSTSWSFTTPSQPIGPCLSTPSSTLAVCYIYFLDKLGTGPGPTPDFAHGDSVLCEFDAVSHKWISIGASCSPIGSPSDPSAVARYVAVSAVPMTVSYLILPIAEMFGGGMATSSTLRLQATAGYVQTACNYTPLMICNPSEPSSNTNPNYPISVSIGHELQMLDGSNKGNFGFINAPSNSGGVPCEGVTDQVPCMLAAINSQLQCTQNNEIDITKPGDSTPYYDALNTRFDIWTNNLKTPSPTSAAFAPAANVEKGICVLSGGKCDYSAGNVCPNSVTRYGTTATLGTAATIPLPRDSAFTSDGTASGAAGPIGDGVTLAALQNYWSVVHPGVSWPQELTDDYNSGAPPRFSIYRYEIDHNLIPDQSASGGEKGAPMCATSAAPSANQYLDRRMLVAAVVNCTAAGVHGATPNVPVAGYVKLFMVEPIGYSANPPSGNNPLKPSSTKALYAEVLGVLVPKDKSGLMHSMSVLYR